MRTLRLSLAGTVILALLVGMAAMTLAQTGSDTEESAPGALLSFTMPYGRQTDPGTVEFPAGRISHRDVAFVGTFDADDPRLSGELWSIHNWDRQGDSGGAAIAGLAGIDHADGAWQGTFRGYATPNDERLYYQVNLTGEGAYEGQSATLFIIDNGSGFDVEGMVFPGELPPFPEGPID